MEYKVKDTILTFSTSLGTIRAIEGIMKKSFMAVVASSYSSTGVCTALMSDMLDVLGTAYAKGHPEQPEKESFRDFLRFVDDSGMSYTELFEMYDKLIVGLQYQGKSEEEIEDIILGKINRAEEQRKRLQQRKAGN